MAASHALEGGAVDSGPSPYFPAVVGVELWQTHGIATGTALSPYVVATAGHLVANMLRGCDPFVYERGASRPSPIVVHVANQDGCVYPACGQPDTPPHLPHLYYVDAIVGLRRFIPANIYDCCGGVPWACPACDVPPSADAPHHNFNTAFDIALLHLDRPLQGVEPLDFVAHVTNGWTNQFERAYPLDLAAWPDQLIAIGVGTGGDPGNAVAPFGLRKYGPVRITEWGWETEVLGGNYCDALWANQAPATMQYQCDKCIVESISRVAEGGIQGHGGDSGGPIVVNYTSLGATGIPELPGGDPFVVAVGSSGNGTDIGPATWNAPPGSGDSTEMGSFLLSHIRDWDQDGVPDEHDNCPLAPNVDQSNSNEDAEHKWGFDADEWSLKQGGTACDPIPCADAEVSVSELALAFSSKWGKWGRIIRDLVDVQTIGSHYVASGAQNHVLLGELAVPDVETHYRFCQKDIDAEVLCDESGIDRLLLHNTPPPIDASHPWIPASMRGEPNGLASDHEPLDHPTDVQHRRWRYIDDFQTWVQGGQISVPTGCDPQDPLECFCTLWGCGTNLDGRFWIHSQTTKGTETDQVASPSGSTGVPPTTGYRLDVNGSSVNDDQLSNHYFYYAPDAPFYSVWSEPLMVALPHYFIYEILPLPPLDPLGWDEVIDQYSYLVALEGGSYGLLRKAGKALVVDDFLGDNLRTLLDTPGLVWTSAVEPWLTVSRTPADEGFRALVFAADGTDVIDGVLHQGLQAGSTADFPRPPIARPGSPAPREGFAAVFSRSEDRAFVVGGQHPTTSAPLGDIWTRPVEAPGPWRAVDLGAFEVGTVLAATWSYLDHRLWVLDEVLDGGISMARLYRVAPYDGRVGLVGQWPRLGIYDRHWLVLDRDGQVLFVASSEALKKHSVVRLEAAAFQPTAPLRAFCKRRPKALVLAPFADPWGYSFAWPTRNGKKLMLQRRKKLHLQPCPVSDLASLL